MLLGTGECDLLKGYEIIGQLEPVSLINWPRESQTVARTLSQNSSWPNGECLGLIVSAGLVDWQYPQGEWLPGEERLGPACTLMLGANVRGMEGEAGI